jgi:hypothetical protein
MRLKTRRLNFVLLLHNLSRPRTGNRGKEQSDCVLIAPVKHSQKRTNLNTSPVSSRTSLFSARTTDSTFFTLPPGNVHWFNPAAWRTRRTPLVASSIQAITDTSLVGRRRESLGVALRMLWLNHEMLIKQA